MTAKITTSQASALRLIEQGAVCQQKFGYGAWRIQGASPTVVGRLVSLKLAAWGAMNGDRVPCHITDAGRGYLSTGGE